VSALTACPPVSARFVLHRTDSPWRTCWLPPSPARTFRRFGRTRPHFARRG